MERNDKPSVTAPAQESMTKNRTRHRKPEESASFTEEDDSSAFDNEKVPDGLTLKQAAVIYFGGMALFIAGIVVAGLAT